MAKRMSTRSKLLIASILIGVIFIGVIVSLVAVFAASSQDIETNLTLSYEATEVGGNIKFSYALKGDDFSNETEITFDGRETETSGNLNLGENIVLTDEKDYVVLKLEVTGDAYGGYYLSLEYRDTKVADKNTKFEYGISENELFGFSSLTTVSSVGTIFKNANYADDKTVFVYLKVSIADLANNLACSGNLNVVLTKTEWDDPNLDDQTGISYGYVENEGGSPFAVATGYSGSADEITIDTTSVYGSEMPVKRIEDYAFDASVSSYALTTTFSSVTIGENVETIKDYAFSYNTSLTQVVLGENVKEIKTTAFIGCTGLEMIDNNSSHIVIDHATFNLYSITVVDNNGKISTMPTMKAEPNQFNNRTYYYVEMGEYPQTFAGYTSTTGTNWQPVSPAETITIDYRGTYNGSGYGSIVEKTVYTDGSGNRYIKHTVAAYSTSYTFMGNGGTTTTAAGEAWFKLEPIKWDVVGYYTDDNKTTFVKVSDTTNFDPDHKENIVVKSRDALQGMAWNSEYTDVDYIASDIQGWLRNFEDNFLAEYKDTNIEKVTNDYNDTNETDKSEMTGNTAPVAGSVDEYAWLMTYDQAKNWFTGSTDSTTTRAFSPSDFALATRAYQSTSYTTITKPYGGTCAWWLRSSFYGSGDCYAGYVSSDGRVSSNFVSDYDYAVVPALLINL